MMQEYVKFNNVAQVTKFISVIDTLDAHFDLGSGQRVVDAKSLLGVLSLDFSEPLCLRCHSEDSTIWEKIKPFIYKKAV